MITKTIFLLLLFQVMVFRYGAAVRFEHPLSFDEPSCINPTLNGLWNDFKGSGDLRIAISSDGLAHDIFPLRYTDDDVSYITVHGRGCVSEIGGNKFLSVQPAEEGGRANPGSFKKFGYYILKVSFEGEDLVLAPLRGEDFTFLVLSKKLAGNIRCVKVSSFDEEETPDENYGCRHGVKDVFVTEPSSILSAFFMSEKGKNILSKTIGDVPLRRMPLS